MAAKKRKSWFNIVRNSADEGTIDIFDEIGFWGVTAKDFVNQLRALGSVSRLNLNIDCPGGDCNDGLTIYDAIRATNAQVTASVIGISASMASVIMLAAQKIRIAENGRVMVHRVTSAAGGNADELDAAARTTRQFEDRIVQLYMERTKQDEAVIRDWMKANNGTWFFGQEAVDHGFADEVITGAKARAFQQRWAGMFTMLPAALFDTSHIPNPPPTPSAPPIMKKLSDAQKARLKELTRNAASLDEDDKQELAALQERATKEGYDVAAEIVSEDAAAAERAKGEGAAAIETAVNKAVAPLQAKITEIEGKLAQGIIPGNLGGAPPVPGAVQDDPAKTLTRAEFDKLDHPARNKFMREGGKIKQS